jgi:5-methylcytosine-specific restriction endonuclease McrA
MPPIIDRNSRKRLTPKQRLSIFVAHEGICHICGVRINGVREKWDVEHLLALADGGSDDLGNLRPAHVACHRRKTSVETTSRAKSERVKLRHFGAVGPKTPKSRFKRKLDGSVVDRETGEVLR